MPIRKICYKCGRINEKDAGECVYCDADISETRKESVSVDALKFSFYNKFTKESTNEPPFEVRTPATAKPIAQDSAPQPARAPIAQAEEKIASRPTVHKHKKCPTCGELNDVSASRCYACETRLTEENCVPELEFIEETFAEEKTEEFFLLIGVDGVNNEVPVVFTNDRFLIGREYQSCLSFCGYISRRHCLLKRMEDGSIYLAESAQSPSANGTYILMQSGRKVRLEPGKGFRLTPGAVFYLDDITVTFSKR